MAIIKLGIRNNLFYPMVLIIIKFFREADLIILDKIISIENIIELKTLIMFLSELISGLILYRIHLKFINKKVEQSTLVSGIKLIQAQNHASSKIDSDLKIYFYIFIMSFLDFIVFYFSTLKITIFNKFSKTLERRLQSLLAFYSSLLCHFLLKIPIYRHQKCSLYFIFICLIIVIISEYYFCWAKVEINHLTLLLLFIFIQNLFYIYLDIIEKYLLDYDFINPFQMLMFEGLFGFIITIIFLFINNPLKNKDIRDSIYKVYKEFSFIVCLILYLILSGVDNSYRVFINKLYSPITLSLTYCFLAPFIIIFYNINFFNEQPDILKDNKYYLIINLVLSFFIDFCICVYNEVFVLFCLKLEKETYLQISIRSIKDTSESIKELIELI